MKVLSTNYGQHFKGAVYTPSPITQDDLGFDDIRKIFKRRDEELAKQAALEAQKRSTQKNTQRTSQGGTRKTSSQRGKNYTPRHLENSPRHLTRDEYVSHRAQVAKKKQQKKTASALALAALILTSAGFGISKLNSDTVSSENETKNYPQSSVQELGYHVDTSEFEDMFEFQDSAQNPISIDNSEYDDVFEQVSSEIQEGVIESDFDFELNLSPEQEYSVEKFIENWEKNHERYEAIEDATGVPAELVAAIHWREASGNFNRCLHDGTLIGEPVQSPLDQGKVFWSFEDSAIAVLSKKYDGHSIIEGDYDTYFDFAERYNGLGYSYRGVSSPYVWAGTDSYTSGKYIADGKYDPNYVDKQPGVAVLLESIC